MGDAPSANRGMMCPSDSLTSETSNRDGIPGVDPAGSSLPCRERSTLRSEGKPETIYLSVSDIITRANRASQLTRRFPSSAPLGRTPSLARESTPEAVMTYMPVS